MDSLDYQFDWICGWAAWCRFLPRQLSQQRRPKYSSHIYVRFGGFSRSRTRYWQVRYIRCLYFLYLHIPILIYLHILLVCSISRACDVLRSIGNLKVFSDSVDKQKRHASTDPAEASPFKLDGSVLSAKAPLCIKDGFALTVLPNHLLLTKLNVEFFSMDKCAPILVCRFVLYI